MPLPYSNVAYQFGRNLYSTFQKINGPPSHGPHEVQKFENLIKSFGFLGASGFQVGNYHGKYSQVEFHPTLPWTRLDPRCELADVLFVAYDNKQMRISFLQAKSKVHTKPFPIWIANTEQFIVLSHRPTITRWLGTAVWNNDVLSKAILPSIGSFGTFTGVLGGSVDFTYSSADCLVPRGAPKASGKYISGLFDLSYPPAIGRKDVSSFYERTYCPNMIDFGTAIFSLEIGSPISYLGSPLDSNVSALNARIALSRWASQESIRSPNDLILKGLLDSPHLIDLPSEQTNGHNLLGAKHVVVIKANA